MNFRAPEEGTDPISVALMRIADQEGDRISIVPEERGDPVWDAREMDALRLVVLAEMEDRATDVLESGCRETADRGMVVLESDALGTEDQETGGPKSVVRVAIDLELVGRVMVGPEPEMGDPELDVLGGMEDREMGGREANDLESDVPGMEDLAMDAREGRSSEGNDLVRNDRGLEMEIALDSSSVIATGPTISTVAGATAPTGTTSMAATAGTMPAGDGDGAVVAIPTFTGTSIGTTLGTMEAGVVSGEVSGIAPSSGERSPAGG